MKNRNTSGSVLLVALSLAACAAPARFGAAATAQPALTAPPATASAADPPLAKLDDPTGDLPGRGADPAAVAHAAEDDDPLDLVERLGAPDWLELSFEQRTRYESLDEEFRSGRDGSQQLWALRTLLGATAHAARWRFAAEIMDSREFGAPDDAVLGTSIVNAGELLQAYVGYRAEDVFAPGDELDVAVGRQTLDIGSRRLVARNRFRNTINAFSGVHGEWTSNGGETVRAFYVHPMRRLPRDPASLDSGDVQTDEEQNGTRFYGVHGDVPLSEGLGAEAYVYRLEEHDRGDVPTNDRALWTVGARVKKKPRPGEWDYEWESALQFGDSRASSSGADTTDLDHRAEFHHLSVGYQFDGEMKPHLEALLDYASGDEDPTDGENNRFDTLFGARRFELGPTGIFGAFARSNLFSPGVRLNLSPREDTQVMLAHRLHYLASKKDAWTTSGLVDPAGDSGRFVGQLAEVRVRHDLVPDHVRLEGGLAYLFAGEFIDDAPNATGQGDSTFVYLQSTVKF